MFLREKLFLQLIAYSEDKKQKFQIIKCINHNQYFELKKIAINILQGVLPSKRNQLKYLKNSKTLIRKLAEGKVTNKYLATHYMIISYIVKIALEYNEEHSKTRISSNRKVGKIRINEPVKEVSVKTVPLKDQAFQKKAISQVKNQQGQGMMIPQKYHQLSPTKSKKGLELFKLLRKNDNIKLNKKGEICYKGKLLKTSNVYDLINHAIHSNKNPPIHMRSFYKILAKSNIPNKFIRNKEGRNIMNKQIKEIDEGWRPPGRLKYKT